jgi:hypothetical protein
MNYIATMYKVHIYSKGRKLPQNSQKPRKVRRRTKAKGNLK